jgi:hypothetical protein
MHVERTRTDYIDFPSSWRGGYAHTTSTLLHRDDLDNETYRTACSFEHWKLHWILVFTRESSASA